jgi:hypothetical protein
MPAWVMQRLLPLHKYLGAPNWTGRVFVMTIRGVPPTTGDVRIDFHTPLKASLSTASRYPTGGGPKPQQ